MKNNVPSVKSAERVVDLLELLSQNPSQGLTMDEIISELDIPRSSFYNLSRMLIHRGFLSKPSEGVYKLGMKVFEIGSSYASNMELLDVSRPIIQELNKLTTETINITIFDKESLEVIVVLREGGLNSLQFVTKVGSRLPAYQTASGRVFLYQYTEEEIEKMYSGKLSPNEIIELNQKLKEIRQIGVSVANGESYKGVYIIAVPIFNFNNDMIGALNIGAPTHIIEQDGESKYVSLLEIAASYLSNLMGYRQPSIISEPSDLKKIWEKEVVNYEDGVFKS